MPDKKRTGISRDQRRMRTQNIVIAIVGVLIILSLLISLIQPF